MRYLEQSNSQTENRRFVSRGWWGGGVGSECLMGTVSVKEDSKVLKMEGGNGRTTMWTCLGHWTVHLKMVKMVNTVYFTMI